MQNEVVNGSYAEAEEDEDMENQTMTGNHEKYRVTVSWIKRGIHKGMFDRCTLCCKIVPDLMIEKLLQELASASCSSPSPSRATAVAGSTLT